MTTRQTETRHARSVSAATRGRSYRGDCVEVLADAARGRAVDLSVYSPAVLSRSTPTRTASATSATARRARSSWSTSATSCAELLRVTKPGRLSCCPHRADHDDEGHAWRDRADGSPRRGHRVLSRARAGSITARSASTRTRRRRPSARTARRCSSSSSGRMPRGCGRRSPTTSSCSASPATTPCPIHAGHHERGLDRVGAADLVRHPRVRHAQRRARGAADDDDRHICPLQLGTIERCVRLWSNPGELVLSPFAGIGSEGYEALRHGRRFLGIELKREYSEAAVKNLRRAEQAAGAQLVLPVDP